MLKCSRKREAAEDRGHGRDALQIHCLQGIYSSLSSKHCNVAWTTHHSTHAEKLYLIVYWLELNSWNCMTDTHVTELWHMFDRLTNTDRWPISVTLHWHTGHTDRWHISVTLTHWTHWQMTDDRSLTHWHTGHTDRWQISDTCVAGDPRGLRVLLVCGGQHPGRECEHRPPRHQPRPPAPPSGPAPGQPPVRPPGQDVMMSETHNLLASLLYGLLARMLWWVRHTIRDTEAELVTVTTNERREVTRVMHGARPGGRIESTGDRWFHQ